MEKKITKKTLKLHAFSYQILLEYIKSRLIINSVISTNVVDIYKDYLYYIFLLSEQEKKKNGLEAVPKDMGQFAHQAFTESLIIVGLISKRNFGYILEKILKEKQPSIARKRSKSIFIEGVGLKSAEGIIFIDNVLQRKTSADN